MFLLLFLWQKQWRDHHLVLSEGNHQVFLLKEEIPHVSEIDMWKFKESLTKHHNWFKHDILPANMEYLQDKEMSKFEVSMGKARDEVG